MRSAPFWFAAAEYGWFDYINPNVSSNAKAVRRLMIELISPNMTADNIYLASKMLLIYYQTQARGELLARMTGRAAGGYVTNYIYSIGGRIPGIISRPISFALTATGASIRASIKLYEISANVEDHSFFSILNAIVTGDNRILVLEKELGIQTYFKLRSYLIQNPDAIKVHDEELKALKFIIDKLYEYLTNPMVVKTWDSSNGRG